MQNTPSGKIQTYLPLRPMFSTNTSAHLSNVTFLCTNRNVHVHIIHTFPPHIVFISILPVLPHTDHQFYTTKHRNMNLSVRGYDMHWIFPKAMSNPTPQKFTQSFGLMVCNITHYEFYVHGTVHLSNTSHINTNEMQLLSLFYLVL